MTFREKLADWISGGEMSRYKKSRDFWHSEANRFEKHAWRIFDKYGLLRAALTQIAEQETPSANATVKRMARIAREALN